MGLTICEKENPGYITTTFNTGATDTRNTNTLLDQSLLMNETTDNIVQINIVRAKVNDSFSPDSWGIANDYRTRSERRTTVKG